MLENKRLDLDACKNRVRKARAMLDQQQVGFNIEVIGISQCATLQKEGVDPRAVLEQVEKMCSEVRID